ncbi:MAG: hypothetical protein EBT06_12090 [Gammaproteobacteria bacterium]|nr:hypothetical protein [Gammaproteobacteria bacterium]
MKFEILAKSEEDALDIYDQIAAAMKEHNWSESIVLYSDMPDPRNTEIVHYWVRVGNWASPIAEGKPAVAG